MRRVNLTLDRKENVNISNSNEPKIFSIFPEAKNYMHTFFAENIDKISVEAFRTEFIESIIPSLVKTMNDNNIDKDVNDLLTTDDLLSMLDLKTLTLSTVHKYMLHLGYKYDNQRRTYYNDGHEKPEQKVARYKFIESYFKTEIDCYVWVQISAGEAIDLENLLNMPLRQDIYYEYVMNETTMREYHIDSHTELAKFIHAENNLYGGNLSVRKPNASRPTIIIGQDESAFSQYSFSSKSWKSPRGHCQLLPKSNGETIMISAFVSRIFGLGITLTEDDISKINRYRHKKPEYVSHESSLYINNTLLKEDITDNSPFLQFFDVGVDKQGYWNYNHMSLQTEDITDCLQALFPDHDFVFIFDQSSGHAHKRKNGLSTVGINASWGGKQREMRQTTITEGCLGPYTSLVVVGDNQKMNFVEDDMGPFHLSETEKQNLKYDSILGKEVKPKTKNELLKELVDRYSFRPNRNYNKKELEVIANQFNVCLTHEVDIIKEGWCNKQKGALQILFERGFINLSIPLSNYSFEVKRSWKDDDGSILPQFHEFCLKNLLSTCEDFRNEVSAMEDLALSLSTPTSNVTILFSPKYHCEIAGEGIEYSWGMAKRQFRNRPLCDKRGSVRFRNAVKESISYVKLENVRKFSSRVRRYMLAYWYFHNCELTNSHFISPSYDEIEKFVKLSKTHRSVSDTDTGFIEETWQASLRDSYLL
jgi:hypothetical protein